MILYDFAISPKELSELDEDEFCDLFAKWDWVTRQRNKKIEK